MKSTYYRYVYRSLCCLAISLAGFTKPVYSQPAAAVEIKNVQSGVIEGGKKLKLSFTLTNREQLSEIVLFWGSTFPYRGMGMGQEEVISYSPYYYLGDIFLVYRDKKVPFQSDQVELELDIPPASGSTQRSITLFALDKKRIQSTPINHSYQ